MASLFTGARHAQQYMLYRPTYPPQVYTTIIDYCRVGAGSFTMAVDLGCGSGQSTLPLAGHFRNVIGLDPSQSQVVQAEAVRRDQTSSNNDLSHVDYSVGSAEDLSRFADGTVDLLTCAQSFHWLDTEKFYPEARRVLSKTGVLAVYGYGDDTIDKDDGNDLISEFYNDTLATYWDERKRHLDEHLAAFSPLPLPDATRIDTMQIERDMSLSAFIGYVSSCSAYQSYIKQHPESQILTTLQTRLCQVYGVERPEDTKVKATAPVFMLLGRNMPTF